MTPLVDKNKSLVKLAHKAITEVLIENNNVPIKLNILIARIQFRDSYFRSIKDFGQFVLLVIAKTSHEYIVIDNKITLNR